MQIEEKPTWKVGLEKHSYPKLEQNIMAEVAIIGGGLAGILTAYLLAKSGKKVVVLEKKKIGSGATEYTTAFLTQDIDTNFADLVDSFGEKEAKLVWQSHAEAINLIEKIVDTEQIDCEFVRTTVHQYANSEKEKEELIEERNLQSKFGFDVGYIKTDDNLFFKNIGYYELKNQAKFHPLKFLMSLAKKSQESGVQIFEESEVTKIKHHHFGVDLECGEYKVTAKQVIIATYQPFYNRIRLFLKRGMYRSYVIEARLKKDLIPEGLYWDMYNPYRYFRIDPQTDHDRMILGGEDIKTIFKSDPEKSFGRLDEHLQSILKGEEYRLVRRWIGPILESSDGLALIGQTRDHEFVASAFSGNGMTYSAIAAKLLHDQILGIENIYAELYDPKRIPGFKQLWIKGRDYTGEVLGGVAKNIFRSNES